MKATQTISSQKGGESYYKAKEFFNKIAPDTISVFSYT